MPRNPTPTELDRHRRAVAKLRAELFRSRPAAELRIDLSSEKIQPPYVSGRVGEPATFGGLSYRAEAERPGEWYEVSVTHDVRDVFTIHIINRRAAMHSFTRFAVTRPFRQVADTMFDLLNVARQEDRQWR